MLAGKPHDVADDLRHGLVMFRRDGLVDLDGGVERAGQRRVFDDRDSCSSATSRMRSASASMPLATQIGAAILPDSYLSATA